MTGVTVLVVDDSKTVRRKASALLAEQGWTVVTANDGFDALAKVVEFRPSIVITDIVMSRLDGYQTCALIKNNADFQHIPVVMLSNKDGLFDRARGRVVGADAHLPKSHTDAQLVDMVHSLVLSSRAGKSTHPPAVATVKRTHSRTVTSD